MSDHLEFISALLSSVCGRPVRQYAAPDSAPATSFWLTPNCSPAYLRASPPVAARFAVNACNDGSSPRGQFAGRVATKLFPKWGAFGGEGGIPRQRPQALKKTHETGHFRNGRQNFVTTAVYHLAREDFKRNAGRLPPDAVGRRACPTDATFARAISWHSGFLPLEVGKGLKHVCSAGYPAPRSRRARRVLQEGGCFSSQSSVCRTTSSAV